MQRFFDQIRTTHLTNKPLYRNFSILEWKAESFGIRQMKVSPARFERIYLLGQEGMRRTRPSLSTLPFSSSASSSSCFLLLPPTKRPPPAPLSSLLPPSLNPTRIAVDLICSAIKQRRPPHDHLSFHLQPHLLRYLRSGDVLRILLRCQSHPLPSLSFFHWARTHLPARRQLTAHSYCVVAHILAWSRLFSKAIAALSDLVRQFPQDDVFHHLVRSTDGCNWSPAVFGMALKVFVKMGRTGDGLLGFGRMIDMGILPGTNDCNCLLNGLLKANLIHECWKVYREMRRVGIPPNTYTFNIMTHVLCKGGEAGKAKEFMEEMEVEGFDPDVVTYNTLITGYCRKRRVDDAFYLYGIMYRRGMVPDTISYTILISGLCRGGRAKEAHHLFHQMLQRGLEADGFVYDALIMGYCDEGKMLEARSVLKDMIQARFLPDACSCYALVEGYRKTGKLLPCLNLIAQLQNAGVGISAEIYRSIIGSLCKQRRPHAARNLLFNWVLEHSLDPDLKLYNLLIGGYCNGNHIEEALQIKDDMVAKGIKPDLASYRFLIGCLGRSGRSSEGELLMWEMVEAVDLPPVAEVCVCLLSGYCKEGQHMKAESLLTRLSEKLWMREARCYNALIDAYCKQGEISRSLELQDEMLKLGVLPNADTCKSLISGMSQTRG